MYKSLKLNDPHFTNYYVGNDGKVLENMSKINMFIGPNNSGKSRFLRSIFYNDNLEYTSDDFDLENEQIKNNEFFQKLEIIYEKFSVKTISTISQQLLKVPSFISPETQLNRIYSELKKLRGQSILEKSIILNPGRALTPMGIRSLNESIHRAISEYLETIEHFSSFDTNNFRTENIYVPTLRGLRGLSYSSELTLLSQDNYYIRTKMDYFPQISSKKLKIYTGADLYEDVKKLLLGSTPDRNKIKDFEQFISSQFFDKQEFNIIPHIEDNAVHVRIGEVEHPIYNLGEGIQSIIILTYPLFFNQGIKMNVFYEEPDQFLHPGFQRIFLETLCLKRFDSFQFYFTTHSNHFLDMTLDFENISVYTFQKDDNKFIIENVENDDKNILEILGVRNSSVFLTNCTIWVEGITDRIYLRKYLEIIQKAKPITYKEDVHFSFLEYGGGNITHWSFLENEDLENTNINVEKLCGKLFLVTDKDGEELNKDGAPSKKLERQQKLKLHLKNNYYCLKAREIENLLTPKIISKTLIDYQKNSNKIDFSNFEEKMYKTKKLGAFIDGTFVGLNRKYSGQSGSLNNKVDFAKKATKHMSTINDLSPEAITLAELIYDFIKANNT